MKNKNVLHFGGKTKIHAKPIIRARGRAGAFREAPDGDYLP